MSAPSDIRQAAAVANGFYAVYGTFHPSDGIPDTAERAKLEPVISPALDTLLRDAAAAEKHFADSTKHQAPPLIEGDLFTSNFEGATAWHVGTCRISGNEARCPVAFGYRGNATEDAKPVNWTDSLSLARTNAGWRVDDIGYGGTAEFGNNGRLTETLRSAIRDGNSTPP
ncbi:MAG TPA: hypothetical protein VGL35_02775 [Rhizomicrobium sp.]